MKTCKALLSALFIALAFNSIGQEGLYLGEELQPEESDSTAALQNYGVVGDFSGGYDVGDYVADFTAYDLEGNEINMYEKIAGDKPVIICSGSVTCSKFVDMWDLTNPDPGNIMARQFVQQTADTYEWIFMYNLEAHPGDLENCTSNCPAIAIAAPNGEYVYQHQTYGERQDALQLWEDIIDSQAYTFDMYHTMYVDNPSNAIYNTYFERPYGILVLDCEGMVIARGVWTSAWLSSEGGIEFLEGLDLAQYETCGAPECTQLSVDTDGDGICDALENWEGSDPEDACDPDNTDTDGDGYCDLEEILMEWDADDPCVPEVGEACELCPDGAVDTDLDGICDDQEELDGTDPDDPCSPNGYDGDLDGLCDMEEELNGSDPEDPCDPDDTDTDGDGYCDIEELLNGTDPDDVNDPDPQTSVNELDESGLAIYPNPVSDMLNVQNQESVLNWVVYDMFGRSVSQDSPLDIQFEIDCADLPAGSYLLMIYTHSGQNTKRFVRN